MAQDINKSMQELQIYEQSLQSFLMQKQQIQMELNEITNALNEVSKSSGNVYRVLSGVMLKSDKLSITKDLEEKKKTLNLRVQALDKQESLVENKIENLRKDITAFNSNKK